MALFQTSAMGQLNNILGLAGGTAQNMLNQKNPGAAEIRSTMGQIGKAPAINAGGQLFQPGESTFEPSLTQSIPAATLPILQAETPRKLGAASVQGTVGGAQAQEQSLQLAQQQALQRQLESVLQILGVSPGRTAGIGGAFGLLGGLLGI